MMHRHARTMVDQLAAVPKGQEVRLLLSHKHACINKLA